MEGGSFIGFGLSRDITGLALAFGLDSDLATPVPVPMKTITG